MKRYLVLCAAGCWLLASSLPGCTALNRVVNSVFGGPEVKFTRTAPAAEDLPNTSVIGIADLRGKAEDASAISGYLGTYLSGTSRFQIVERSRLEQLAQEKGCSATEVACFSGALPASALIVGDVTESRYSEGMEVETYECVKGKNKKATCVSRTRKGTARVTANLRLVETESGKVLLHRMVNQVESASENAVDGVPAGIDSAGLLERARESVALQFFQAIAPHDQQETVEMAEDGDLPELALGIKQLEQGDHTTAASTFEGAIRRAEAAAEIDPEVKGMAYYNLGVTFAIAGDFDKALEHLRKASAIAPEDEWVAMQTRVTQWKGEAAAVQRQLAYGQAAAPAPAPSATPEPAPEAVSNL